jgi:cyanophycinase-like exopeptidase
MPQANVIRWRNGAGWIVLSGGEDPSNAEATEIEAEALARVAPGEPMAYIWAAGNVEDADERLSALEELGAPTGYLVDVQTEDDETIRKQLSEAGMIVIGDGPDPVALRSAMLGAALDGMISAYEQGAVILGIGSGAAVLGNFLGEKEGLNWIEKAVIQPHYERENGASTMHAQLAKHPDAYGIGLGSGSALALGPKGEIAAWGKKQITVAFGSKISPTS